MVAISQMFIKPKQWQVQFKTPSISDCLYDLQNAHILFVTTISMCKRTVSI